MVNTLTLVACQGKSMWNFHQKDIPGVTGFRSIISTVELYPIQMYQFLIVPGVCTRRLDSFRIMNVWVMDQWSNSSKCKHHFFKSLRSNLICSKAYKNINIFWVGEQKVIVLTALYFIGFFLFLKKNIFCLAPTKILHETDSTISTVSTKKNHHVETFILCWNPIGYHKDDPWNVHSRISSEIFIWNVSMSLAQGKKIHCLRIPVLGES